MVNYVILWLYFMDNIFNIFIIIIRKVDIKIIKISDSIMYICVSDIKDKQREV